MRSQRDGRRQLPALQNRGRGRWDDGISGSCTIGAKGKGSLGRVVDGLLESTLSKKTTKVGDKLQKMLQK